ncbi:MAG: hypothetical protein ABSH32_17415 [Bryobacteraceae bacterium]|jgi:uncharacterized glyoxalase superfamily protein PhnB
MREAGANGKVWHAEVKIGDSQVMITDEASQFPELRSVRIFGGSTMKMFLNVDEADALCTSSRMAAPAA